jgi:acetyl-CoA C-acetyltransferase
VTTFTQLGAGRADGESRSYDEICVDHYPGIDHIEHVHHAGNSSGVVDGAAAVVLAQAARFLKSKFP